MDEKPKPTPEPPLELRRERRAFVEPAVSEPQDVLEATSLFLAATPTAGTTTI